MSNKKQQTFNRSDIELALSQEFPNLNKSQISLAIDSILESGILIYLSSTWLSEVYQIVVGKDLFEGCQIGTPIVNLCSGNIIYNQEECAQNLK